MANILILRAPGTNSDLETAYAFERAGGKTQRIHINRVLEKPEILQEYQVLCFPGGFSFGDDIAAGKILAYLLKSRLIAPLQKFKEVGKLILGIGNGFQTLVKSGLLFEESSVTLSLNQSSVFADCWSRLRVEDSKCVFLRGIESLYLPIAHAEGQFIARDSETLNRLQQSGQVALKYASGENPDGSQGDIAGLCDTTGRVFGLMPLPERYIDPLQHPHWTRTIPKDRPRFGDGFKLFQNAIEYFR